jgi:signal transduction histidine kinase
MGDIRRGIRALQTMPEGGTLTVSLRPGSGQRLLIGFQDSGPGIAPDILARRPERVLTTKLRGLGLGPSIAARLRDRFGATLPLEDAVPQGVRVTPDVTTG